ncbi:MAG: Disulfide bond formation protein B [Chlamydiales bacterium]|nr:Disulfide bond formation protein B [Chlamydiales bacterium]
MTERNLNALMALILSCVLWGGFAFQFIEGEHPCVLCLLQRLGMLGVAFGALLNVKFGSRKAHYSLSLFSALFGGFVALRHIALHACPGTPIFGEPFWGLSLYTWSFIVFVSSVAYIALLMLIFDHQKEEFKFSRINWWGRLAFFSVFLVALTNIVTTLLQCGLGDCNV